MIHWYDSSKQMLLAQALIHRPRQFNPGEVINTMKLWGFKVRRSYVALMSIYDLAKAIDKALAAHGSEHMMMGEFMDNFTVFRHNWNLADEGFVDDKFLQLDAMDLVLFLKENDNY